MAPTVKLCTWKVLVWSEARNAEGEKEELTNLSILLKEPACRQPIQVRLCRIVLESGVTIKISFAKLVNFAQFARFSRFIVSS